MLVCRLRTDVYLRERIRHAPAASGGQVTYTNPAEALRGNGDRVFQACRERDGMKIWGLRNPQSNPWIEKRRGRLI